ANFYNARLTSADLTDAVIAGANFAETTLNGFTKEQLYSTASYKAKDLQRISLSGNDLSGWNFAGQDLRAANFYNARLTSADLTDAVISGANFEETTLIGFTKEQLYSTASYKTKTLEGVSFQGSESFPRNDLSGWNFAGQNLTGARFARSSLANTDFTDTIVKGADFAHTGLTKEQLYSTASYKAKNLRGIKFDDYDYNSSNDLTGWDFSGQDLTGAKFGRTLLAKSPGFGYPIIIPPPADLSFADLRGAEFFLWERTVATLRNTISPDGKINSLNLAAGERLVAFADVPIPVVLVGGFSIAPNASVDLTDNAAILDNPGTSTASAVREHIISGRGGSGPGGDWTGTGITSSTAAAANQAHPDSRSLGYADNAKLPLGPYTSFHGAAVDETSILIAFTRTGDANLDGVVNDDDVTIVGATYAPGVPNGSWALGDFDYNGFVDDDDVTLLGVFYDPSAQPFAVAASGIAAATGVASVPEPSSFVLLFTMAAAILFGHRSRRAVYRQLSG
ncbi:MAG: pentapeptide repeat-containing protein, partial [Pirellulales bacterium]